MNKFYETLTNLRGDVLFGYRAQVVDETGASVDIYRDRSGTRFTDGSGNIVNYAEASSDTGMAEFYWNAATGQILQITDSAGELARPPIIGFGDNYVLGNLSGDLPTTAIDGLDDTLAAKADTTYVDTNLATKVPTADLASTDTGKGAALVGAKSPFTGTVARSLVDTVDESRSILEWFTDVEKAAARAGDLSVDHTAAIQLALDSGAPVLDMHDYAYRVDGELTLPTAGIKLIGNGWSIERGVANNSDKLFVGAALTGGVEMAGGTLTGNVDRLGVGYSNTAAAIRITGGVPFVTMRDMNMSVWASGLQVYQVAALTLLNSKFNDNHLTGVSGIANNVLIDGCEAKRNGYVGSGNLTHDIYIINGSGGKIINCDIGPNLDTASSSLTLRYDESDSSTGFDDVADWVIANSSFDTTGLHIGSDTGVAVANRKPPKRVKVTGNKFKGGADLWFDDVEACKSENNTGIDTLQVRIGSSYSGYVPGLLSTNDECNQVSESALTTPRAAAATGIIFRSTTIHNSTGNAFVNTAGFGGNAACTIIDPNPTGSGVPFDSNFLSVLASTSSDFLRVRASGRMKKLNRSVLSDTLVGTTAYTPDNHSSDEAPINIRLGSGTATINAPTTSGPGMVLELLIEAAWPTGSTVITFNSAYKLTENTAAVINTSVQGEFIFLRFTYAKSKWVQLGDASWTAA